MRILFIGISGAGKDTQAELLRMSNNYDQLPAGEILRKRAARGDAYGQELEKKMLEGFLDGSEVFNVIKEYLKDNPLQTDNIIFNACVRKVEQIAMLDELLADNNTKLDKVILFNLDQEVAIERLLERGSRVGRKDDNRESIAERISDFKAEIDKIVATYQQRGILVELDGNQEIIDIHHQLLNELSLEESQQIADQLSLHTFAATIRAYPSLIGSNLQVTVEVPKNTEHGDWAANVALTVTKQLRLAPFVIATKITVYLESDPWLAEQGITAGVATGGAPFINFKFTDIYLSNLTKVIIAAGNNYGSLDKKSKLTYLLEHTSPNPNKAMHIGHLRNTVTAMALGNIWKHLGINVILDCIDNNRGISIAKLMWGFLYFARKSDQTKPTIEQWVNNPELWFTPEELKVRPDMFVDELYVKAVSATKEDKDAESEVRQFVIDWENDDQNNHKLWAHVLNYSHTGQHMTLARLGSKWDNVWHESDVYRGGKEWIEKGLTLGVFKTLPDGAVLTDFSKYGIPDTIVRRSDGTALYITQDIQLTQLKKEKFNPDRMFWVIGPEQSLAMQQVFTIAEQLEIGKLNEFTHIAYGSMTIKGSGKISSRLGNVVYIDQLLDFARDRVSELMQELRIQRDQNDGIAEHVGIGAVKYSILKIGRLTDLAFDFDESISFSGDSGPYVMYAYARAQNILEAARSQNYLIDNLELNKEEDLSIRELIRCLAKFPLVIESAGNTMSPNLVCSYLFELAQAFSTFYDHIPVLKGDKDKIPGRLAVVQATATVLGTGLNLLGIEPVERM